VNIKIAGKWMFIPLKMVLIGIDPMSFLITTMIYILVFRTADLFLVTPSCPALALIPSVSPL
jgi:hypothetical protein